MLERLQANVRESFRQLRTAPVHSLLLVMVLATGLASAVAIFTVVRGVILRPLPYPDAERLVALQEYQPARRRDQTTFSQADLTDYRDAIRSADGLAGLSYSELVISGTGSAERVIGARVESGVLPLFGARPLYGRLFAAGGDSESPAREAVISASLWRRRFAGDSSIIGRSIMVDGESFVVIGVTAPRFEFPRSGMMDREIEIWTPLARSTMAMNRRGMRSLTVFARLKPGVSLPAAEADLAGVASRLAQSFPQTNAGWSVRAVPLRELIVGRVRPTLVMLSICVIGLLGIVIINAAAAILARATTRAHGLAIRLALGASRRAIAELLVAESVLIALIAGIVALPVGGVLRGVLVAAAPVALPRLEGVGMDVVTAIVTMTAALLIGVLAAVGPAHYLGRIDARTLLSDANRNTAGSRALRRALASLVVVQLALATVLLGATANVYSSYRALNRVDPGFRAADVLTASIALPGPRYATAAGRTELTERLVARIRPLPGVLNAAVASLLPMAGGMMSAGYTVIGGDVTDTLATAALRSVSSDFFETVGIAVEAGRSFTSSDDGGSPLVVVVNQAFVRQSMGGAAPVGRLVRLAAPGMDSAATFSVVGVVSDAREKDLTSPATPIAYFSDRQVSFPHAVLAVRSSGSVTAAALRSVLAAIDPSLALDEIATLQAKVRATYALPIFLLKVLGVFAVIAMVLVAVGVYASVSFATAAESRAMGIRVALGATRSRILRMVIGRNVALAAAGCGIGGAVLALAGRALPLPAQGAAIGIPDALAGVATIICVVALAGYLPARRASRADPVAVLHG